jgi:hypothetical protein
MKRARPAGQYTLLAALMTLVVALGLRMVAEGKPPPSPPHAQAESTPTMEPLPTSDFPNPIFTDQDSLLRCLEYLGITTPNDAVVRLVSHHTLCVWLLAPVGIEDELQGCPDDFTPPEFNPDHPAWIVGILADGLTNATLAGLAVEEEFLPETVVPLPGAYCAWDANSGLLAGFGSLSPTPPIDYGSIASLPNEQLSILPATDIAPDVAIVTPELP